MAKVAGDATSFAHRQHAVPDLADQPARRHRAVKVTTIPADQRQWRTSRSAENGAGHEQP